MSAKPESTSIPVSRLKKMFSLGGPTGLIWNKRPLKEFASERALKIFQTKCEGLPAGCISNRTGYVFVGIDRKVYLAHRIVFAIVNGRWPKKGMDVDHKNQDKTNNRPSNLREVSRGENIVNNTTARSACGYRNIYETKGSFIVQLWKDKRCVYTKSFKSLSEAIQIRDTMKIKLYGEL